jgi:hypothetical protein
LADLASGDHSVHGAVEGQQERRGGADEQTSVDREQTLADVAQIASDNQNRGQFAIAVVCAGIVLTLVLWVGFAIFAVKLIW